MWSWYYRKEQGNTLRNLKNMKKSINGFKGKFEENFQKWEGKDRYRNLEWIDKVVVVAIVIKRRQ